MLIPLWKPAKQHRYNCIKTESEPKIACRSTAKRRRGEDLTADEIQTLAAFDDDIEEALPVGLSEAHRLVQEAVATFLKERRTASETRLRSLRAESKSEILRILRGVAG